MKIRSCFVSNSSSSSSIQSECYMGIEFYCPESVGLGPRYWDKLRDVGLRDVWHNGNIVGLPIHAMGDQETVAQFRLRVFEALKKLGFNEDITNVDWVLPTVEVED